MGNPTFAYLAAGQAHLAHDDGTSDAITSKFVEDVRKREASIERKTAWKTKGTGARFMGAAALWDDVDGRRAPAFFTAIARGRKPGEILYGLSTGVVSGIFAYDVASATETRLFHGTEPPLSSLASSDDHTVLAFSRAMKNGSMNIAVMRDDGGDAALVTDGDTIDDAPSWVPVGPEVKEGRHQLVYQSCGVGRDASGIVAGFGPSEIMLLDAEHGQLKTLVADDEHDWLAPRMTRDGTLWAMRRPYLKSPNAPNAGRMVKDGLFAPFRLLYAGFRYLDFFTMRYTGKPLATSGDTRGRAVDARRLLERRNVAAAGDGDDDEDAFTAPSEWELVKRTPSGEETVVAKSVLAYEIDRDGALVSDGKSITRIHGDGKKTRVAATKLVTSVVRI